MKPRNLKHIAVSAMVGLLCACTLPTKVTPEATATVNTTQMRSCPPLPSTFKETDLIGTWVASYSLNDTDTLILKEDGTYMQIYVNPDANQKYESGWQKWQIERRDSGYIRLHLKGMRRAGETVSLFNREGGGIDPSLYRAIDDCEGKMIEMPDELVLVVTGAQNVPRGIELRQMRLSGSDWTWSFTLSAK